MNFIKNFKKEESLKLFSFTLAVVYEKKFAKIFFEITVLESAKIYMIHI